MRFVRVLAALLLVGVRLATDAYPRNGERGSMANDGGRMPLRDIGYPPYAVLSPGCETRSLVVRFASVSSSERDSAPFRLLRGGWMPQ